MSDYDALNQMEMYAEDSIDAKYGTLSAALIADLVKSARKEHAAELAKAWDEGHSWGWSDAQEAHDVRQDMAREDWSLKTPNPYRADQAEEDQQERKGSIMDYAGIWGPRPEGLDVVEWQREIRDEQ